jgi:hypothetical protein
MEMEVSVVDQMDDLEPGAGRPYMPGYGIKPIGEGAGLFSWHHVSQQMATARNYWISTVRPDGRPHAVPVWGIWLDRGFMFSAGNQSRKARNLAANPTIVVHLESGDDVIILEGAVEEMVDPELGQRYADAYEAKYQWRPDPADPETVTYLLCPQVAFAWLEEDFPGTATRWVFADE